MYTNVKMAEQGPKYLAVKGGNDKCAIILTFVECLTGVMLPCQVNFTGKTKRCMPRNVLDNKDKMRWEKMGIILCL